MTPLHEAERFVRLGAGVDATGAVGPAAMARLREALLAYRDVARAWGVRDIVVGATSASRDARNRAELIDYVRRETGLSYEILSGDDEALWSFAGAVSAFDDLTGSCAVLDIGGGSTEIVVGEAVVPVGPAEASLSFRRSLDIGAVRLTERYFHSQPPAAAEVARAEALVRDLLASARPPLVPALPLVGAAGTVSSLALVHGGAASWDELAPAQQVLGAGTVHAWRERLLAMSYEEVLALNPPVMQGRADVMAAGVLVLDVVMQRFDIPRCRVSPRGLRHGLALRAME